MTIGGRSLAAGLILAAVGALGAVQAQAAEAQVRPRQLVTQYTCGQVQGIESDLKRASELSADSRTEVEIVWAKCAADDHNKNHPDQPPQVVLVTPDQSALATANKTFFTTVSLTDSAAIQQFCNKVSAGGPSVATEAGPVACDAFVRSAKANNPLIILTPADIDGSGVTTRILALIGSEAGGKQVQLETNHVKAVVPGTAQGAQAVIDHPVVQIASTSENGQLGGTGHQFLHAAKCVGTLGFGGHCDAK